MSDEESRKAAQRRPKPCGTRLFQVEGPALQSCGGIGAVPDISYFRIDRDSIVTRDESSTIP